ncbi:MAG: hypothetical protein WAV18_25555 [Roseiarcus sp.]
MRTLVPCDTFGDGEARAVPVIFMTAVDSQMVRGEALTAGCVAYVLKPLAPRSNSHFEKTS